MKGHASAPHFLTLPHTLHAVHTDGYDDIADVQRATAGPNLGAGRELQYFERVKVRLRTAAGGAPNVAAGPGQMAFNDMLKCIHLYNQV